jgi:hypothetical protein
MRRRCGQISVDLTLTRIMPAQFKWLDGSARVLFVILRGEHELTLVSATPDGRVAVANLTPKCAPHCDSVRASNIEFMDGGVGLDVLGTGNIVGEIRACRCPGGGILCRRKKVGLRCHAVPPAAVSSRTSRRRFGGAQSGLALGTESQRAAIQGH